MGGGSSSSTSFGISQSDASSRIVQPRIEGQEAEATGISLEAIRRQLDNFTASSNAQVTGLGAAFQGLGAAGREVTSQDAFLSSSFRQKLQQNELVRNDELQQNLAGVINAQVNASINPNLDASPEQVRLIGEAADRALTAGVSDIDRFTQEAAEGVRGGEAAARGLRPSDSPIIDRTSDIFEEGLRTKAQLSSQIRAQQAQQTLDIPLAAQGIANQAAGNAFGFGGNRAALAQQFRRQFDLLIRLGIHENQHAVRFVQKLLIFLLKTHAFHFVSRAEPLVQFRTIAQIAQFDLCKSAAFTGLYVVNFDCGP